jgi:hypothetical protein
LPGATFPESHHPSGVGGLLPLVDVWKLAPALVQVSVSPTCAESLKKPPLNVEGSPPNAERTPCPQTGRIRPGGTAVSLRSHQRGTTDRSSEPGARMHYEECRMMTMRSSGFVGAGAARVAGVLLAKGSGSGLVAVRGGSRNALCLQGVSAAFRIRRPFDCWRGVVTPDGIMRAVERAGLAEARRL